MADIADQLERVMHRLAARAVRHVIEADCSDDLDNRVGAYVDGYVRSPAIREDLKQAVYEFCRDDSEFVLQVRKIVREVIDNEVQQAVAARLQEVQIGDLTFTNWLVRVALKNSLNSEVIRQMIEAAVKTQIQEVMKKILMNGLMGSSGVKPAYPATSTSA